uniref:Methyltransferase domain-containing protein n=1 Tax=Candidatus Kentrum sp. FW TaxID=2126338 RepID=A0A450TWW7_9GAMM|nr:MAG: Methyltransferase domain-containing protein [Candidatus Kentron sp. FW]
MNPEKVVSEVKENCQRQDDIVAFFKQWNIYQDIIANNYMYHAEITKVAKSVINHFEAPSILDLGCGDAYVVSESLIGDRPLTYYGVDISDTALAFARENLAGFDCIPILINNDFLSELENIDHTFDVIISGYTLHHLKTENKRDFFSLVAKALAKRGIFIFYDVETEPNETPEGYYERVHHVLEAQWTNLDREILDAALTHIRENDKPENEAFHRENLEKAGFSFVERVFRDEWNRYSLYVASRFSPDFSWS